MQQHKDNCEIILISIIYTIVIFERVTTGLSVVTRHISE